MEAEFNGIKIKGTPKEMAEMLDSIKNIWIDIAKIPDMFGPSDPDKFKRWLEYASNGVYVIDSTQVCG